MQYFVDLFSKRMIALNSCSFMGLPLLSNPCDKWENRPQYSNHFYKSSIALLKKSISRNNDNYGSRQFYFFFLSFVCTIYASATLPLLVYLLQVYVLCYEVPWFHQPNASESENLLQSVSRKLLSRITDISLHETNLIYFLFIFVLKQQILQNQKLYPKLEFSLLLFHWTPMLLQYLWFMETSSMATFCSKFFHESRVLTWCLDNPTFSGCRFHVWQIFFLSIQQMLKCSHLNLYFLPSKRTKKVHSSGYCL